jgi:hypothetical protein
VLCVGILPFSVAPSGSNAFVSAKVKACEPLKNLEFAQMRHYADGQGVEYPAIKLTVVNGNNVPFAD